MNLDFNVFSLTLLISGLIVTVLSSIIIFRLNDYIRWFAFTMLFVSTWSIAYGFELASTSLESMLFWIKIEYIGISLVPASWLWFCFKYSGLEKWQTKNVFFLISVIPLTTYIMVFTNEYHNMHYANVEVSFDGPFPLLKITPGFWYYVHTIYFYIALALGNIILFKRFKNTEPIFQNQTYVIIASGLFPWVINMMYLLGYRPFEHIDLTPYSFLFLYIIIGIGLLKFDLFDIKPIARDRVIYAMTTGIMVLDPKNRVIDFNPSMLRILGKPKKNLIGKSINTIFCDYEEIINRANAQKKCVIDLRMHFSFTQRNFNIKFIPLFNKQSIFSGLLLQFDDVTEEKNIKEKLMEQTEELQKLNNLKDKLFSIISHDLKGPILGVRELIKLTADGTISQEEFINILPEVSKNMDSVSLLLENLLAWTSTQLKGEYVDKKKFNLTNLINQQYLLFENLAKEKNIEFEIKVENDLLVYADKHMIDLVIRNLISNALKFSNNGDLIAIQATQKENEVEVKIIDTGAGIAKENLEKLEKGLSFTTTGLRNETGTGLGLILVRDYIKKNGGVLIIESELNQGSKFEFSLPLFSEKVKL
ncbi:ATP-binding protein [Belliella sp. R4-6]|uniref:histidine kinase n=1 Tax=Belliella alkalica TaxID=1730871 RepID=A0ABS9VGT3_9BACT|nr:histidine kinase N-terminal 7TM domain-containing protein [Belliella alkalica]MCH7415653.1 ATP-binding protein [Belliella alkalica]